jgi:hypothetical protein
MKSPPGIHEDPSANTTRSMRTLWSVIRRTTRAGQSLPYQQ